MDYARGAGEGGGGQDAKNRTVKGLEEVGDHLMKGNKESSVEEITMEQDLGSQGRGMSVKPDRNSSSVKC